MNKDFYWLNEKSRRFLEKDYLTNGETPEQRIRHIALTSEKILKIKGFADKFESYMAKGWFSLASPIWANFGNKRGCPISCFNSHVSDTMESILDKTSEVGIMTKLGGGTSAYFGELRARGTPISVGGTSSGPVHFMELFETTTNVISQSNIRRGSFAAYLDIDHPDIEEFLKIRGDGNPIQHISLGVCVSDKWMQSMIDGDKKKRDIWAKVIQKRFESGYPYIFYTDNVNKKAPKVYKDKKKKIKSGNLCIEVMLASDEHESFVCCLSSLNLLHYDEWRESDAPEVLTYFLDSVMSEFIEKTEGMKFMEAPHRFAKNQRAIGVGVLGWHSLLQSKSIAFESMQAKYLNNEIFKLINEKTLKASKEMAEKYGEPELLKGYGERNTTRIAIAPTTSSAFILGQVSQSIEALDSNYFVRDLAKGKFTYKNPYLKQVLHNYKEDTSETWEDILKHGGSVQHLKFLSEHEKNVFKTFGEISQMEIIIQASQRQQNIDQSQSLNLQISPQTPVKEVNQLMIEAWKLGIKTLYYQKGSNPQQSLSRNLLSCSSCEG